MVKMQVIYEGELHTLVTHEPSMEILHTDAPSESGGKGRTFSPTDLLAASYASCIATVMGSYAEKKKMDLRGMRVQIEKHMSKEPPRRVEKLELHIWIPVSLSEEEKNKFKTLAETCPIHHSLHPQIEKIILFHWKD